MSKSFSLREVITERLTAAAEEIFGTVEQIVAEYQEEISRSKEENERLRGLLDISVKPVVKLHRTDPQLVTSVQQCEEKALPEKRPGQEWRTLASQSSLIKEEHYLSQQQPRELGPSFREPRLPSSCRKRDGRQNSRHSHLHQTLSEKSRERDPLPTNTAGDIDMHPHEEPQMFSHPICEEDDEAEPEWSPSVEPENLEPPHIKQEHDRWSSPEQPLMQRFDQDSILSSPCTSDRDLRIQQSLTDGNREEPSEALPTDTSGTIQIYPDGSDNGESELTTGCSFWNNLVPTYQCKYCSKCYVSRDELSRHERLHTVKKTYQCQYCGRWYIRKSALNRHERIHTGSDQLECKVCGKRFTYSGDLNRHELVHSGVKPFRCTSCGKCFSQKSNLKRHEMVHK